MDKSASTKNEMNKKIYKNAINLHLKKNTSTIDKQKLLNV